MKVNSPKRFIIISFIVMAALLFCGFFVMSRFMDCKSTDTISDVGQVYMEGMSEQISLHFQTTIGLRLNQVEALVEAIPAAEESGRSHEETQALLSFNANARGFDYLALLSPEGQFEMIYGEKLQITDPDPFLSSLRNGESKVAVGTDAAGNNVVLLGVSSHYCLEDGRPSLALVASLPVDYITKTLSLDSQDAMVYSFIIRQDGSFVIRTNDAEEDTYFNRVLTLYDDVEGKTPEEFLAELSEAMREQRTYSTEFTIYGERRHLFCTRLAYSEWYLLTFMPYSA